MAKRSWNNGVASSRGWMVARHRQTGTLMLLPGGTAPWGYDMTAWTAGSRADGRNLLREEITRQAEIDRAAQEAR